MVRWQAQERQYIGYSIRVEFSLTGEAEIACARSYDRIELNRSRTIEPQPKGPNSSRSRSCQVVLTHYSYLTRILDPRDQIYTLKFVIRILVEKHFEFF